MTEATEGAVEETTANPEGASTTTEATTTTTPAAAGDDWRAAIADEKIRKLADRFTSPADLAKSYAELNSEMGRRIRVPGENATAEELVAFAKAMGVPETPDAYEITKPEHVPEDVWKSEDMQGAIKAITAAAHAKGATPAVVSAVLDTYWQLEAQGREMQQQNDAKFLQEAEAGLRKEWGKDYDANKAFADQALTRMGPDLREMELRDGRLLGSDPAFVKLMAQVGRMTSEGGLQLGLKGTEAGNDLQGQYNDLSRQLYDAYEKGDMSLAREIDAKRTQVSEQLNGVQGIVGSGGRAY